ncbi:MAG: carboxylesterase family protein [Halieaceae bacterium]|jgi:para-nitrobenzyl esterase|nr:carboxylesterase family protein [Halieaceae bacterium]
MLRKIIIALISLATLIGVTVVVISGYLSPEERPAAVAAQETRLSITGGDIVGYDNGRGAWVWRGIPFAAPPVGPNRWRSPQPVESWQGIREVLTDGAECATWGVMFDRASTGVEGSEDCLYLNVFAPAGNTEPLPVMYWIHGGGNRYGSGGGELYDGTALATRFQVVLVAINYRLYGLGWFRHPALDSGNPEDSSGNYGTLDQIAGLRWVQDNIALFGGDPNRVTVFGESAGGWNTLAMMASPLAKGLFHRAIVQSGGLTLEPLSVAENFVDDERPGHRLSSREIVNQLLINDGRANNPDEAKSLQYETSTMELAGWLRGLTAEQFYTAYHQVRDEQTFSFPDLIGDGHVLPGAVRSQALFSNTDNYNSVPVMLGTNLDEMKLFLAFNPERVKLFMNIPVGFHDLEQYNRVNRYSTDEWKVNGVDSLAAALRGAQGDDVYAYRFDAMDLRDFGLIDLRDLFGAAHALEIPYVFGNFPRPMRVLYPDSSSAARRQLSDSMMSYWAEFAYNGHPGGGRDGSEVAWTSWQNGDASSLRLMILDSSSGQGVRMSSERLSVQDLKQRYFSDDNFESQEAYCQGYKMLFRGADFIEQEYAKLGTAGCS